MKAVYLIGLAIIGNGVYMLVQGRIMQGFGTIMFGAFGLLALLVYQHTEDNTEVRRKNRRLPRANPSRRPR